ncbi:TetR/AcrR family transcriptional regulator [Natronorubrum texcoconense]|uniref:DNA-binding transcriptional regulator, AcrR family n=1 Tax=Natronorubrum texcoconense TaxID=1095776 RepID=A0A1G9C214_9EURY|nr:TetR/AcrR family transcriptional regulator [Natronorubrum texcoconense]SDK45710.1 DNA-binding transcriptional regulator, AcrR family [Natronorubrum texcoconense]
MTTPSPPSIPDDTYEELVEATLLALSKTGYLDLRVRDIDAEFPKSRQLIHHYFDGKDELVTETLSVLVDQYSRELDSSPGDDPLAKLNDEIDRVLLGEAIADFDYWMFVTALYEIMAQSHHNRDHQVLINRLTDELVDHFHTIMQGGIDQGVFEDVDTLRLAKVLDDLITGAQSKKIFLGNDDALLETRAMIDRLVISQLVPADTSSATD